MKPQGLYRAEAKKAKLTKAEKTYNHFARVKRRAEARKKKPATV